MFVFFSLWHFFTRHLFKCGLIVSITGEHKEPRGAFGSEETLGPVVSLH